MLLSDEYVDLLKQSHILRHEALVGILVTHLVLAELLSEMINVLFKVLPLSFNLLIRLVFATFAVFQSLFEHIALIESDAGFLQLLEVGNMVETGEDIVFELPDAPILVHPHLHQLLQLIFETLLSLGQIGHNQLQVVFDAAEVEDLLLHLTSGVLQLLDDFLPWPDVSLQLLDLVVEHELELLQLLRLLLQLVDVSVFVGHGLLALLQLSLVRLDLHP